MDRLGTDVLIIWVDAILQVLVHVVCDKRSDAWHHDEAVELDFKESVQAHSLLFFAEVTLHSTSVKSDVPIRELLDED